MFFLLIFYIFIQFLPCRAMEQNTNSMLHELSEGKSLKCITTISGLLTGKHKHWYGHGKYAIKHIDNDLIVLSDGFYVGLFDIGLNNLSEKYEDKLLDKTRSKAKKFAVHPNGEEVFWTNEGKVNSYNVMTKETKENILSFNDVLEVQAIRFDSSDNHNPVVCLYRESGHLEQYKSIVHSNKYSLEYDELDSTALFHEQKMLLCTNSGKMFIYDVNNQKQSEIIKTINSPKNRYGNKNEFAEISSEGRVAIASVSHSMAIKSNILILGLNNNNYLVRQLFDTTQEFFKNYDFRYPFFFLAKSVLVVQLDEITKSQDSVSGIAFIDTNNFKCIDLKLLPPASTLKSVFPNGKKMIIYSKYINEKIVTHKAHIYEVPEKVQKICGIIS